MIVLCTEYITRIKPEIRSTKRETRNDFRFLNVFQRCRTEISIENFVAVYHMPIVASELGLLTKFGLWFRMRSAHNREFLLDILQTHLLLYSTIK